MVPSAPLLLFSSASSGFADLLRSGVVTFVLVNVGEPCWFRSRRPLHLATDPAQNSDFIGCDGGSSEESSELSKDALWALGVEESDREKALLEMAHEPFDLILWCGFEDARYG